MLGHERWLLACEAIGYVPEPRTFPEGTATSADAAIALGCSIGQIAKSIIFNLNEIPVLVITSGQNNVDRKKKMKRLLDEKPSQASADFVLEKTGYQVGGVPPFGHISKAEIFMDEDLMKYDIVWAAAGSSHTVFPITPTELLEISGATLADVKQ
jgi:prolyl-tRNA editing enzyme YbaK/EbsC (Cys-tRNA(Pro) deacylase)